MKWPQIPQKLPTFSYKFVHQVAKFLQFNHGFQRKVFPKKWCFAISGGVDSVSLLFAFLILRNHASFKKIISRVGLVDEWNLEVAHVNHRSRNQREHQMEIQAIAQLCKLYGLPFYVYESERDLKDSNEEEWRSVRKHFLLEHAKKTSSLIVEGHHLDDSWEWSFLQTLKTGDPRHSLGVPYGNGPMIRPFLCVSKKQIKKFAKSLSIPFFKDETSTNMNLERNYLRSKVRPILDKRYPSMLKFHAIQAQIKAQNLGLSWVKLAKGEWWISCFSKDLKILLWCCNSQSRNSVLPKDELLKGLEYLSNHHRGKFSAQLGQLQEAWKNNRSGPIHFSGGLQVKILKNFQIIFFPLEINQNVLRNYIQELEQIRDLSLLIKWQKFFFRKK